MKIDTHWLTGWFGDAAEVSTVAPAPLLMPLEPRIVYDASVASLAGAAHHGHESYMNATARISEVRASEPSAAARISETHASSPVQERMATPPASAAQQVVFIDPNVADYQSLIAGLPAGTAYVVLNQTSDGLAQIAQYLELHPGISSIHLVSHGSEAQVQVGGTLLDLSDLSQYSGELAEIGAAMKPGGDFLIYGCDVAEGSDGQALVQQIAALTDLNVAASTTQIGAASLGGDWTLNYDVGNVTTPVIFSAASEQQYGYVLSQTIEDYTTNPTFDSGSVASFSLDGITYTITKTGGNGDNRIFQDPTLQGLPDENSSDNSLLFDAGGTGGTTAIKITMTNGDAFNMSSLDIDVTANANVTFTTNTGATATPLVSNGNTTSTTISFGSSFNEITSLTIGGGNLAVNLGHLVYTEVGPPTVTTSGGTTNYVGDASATTVDSGVTVTDSSETDQASGTVSIGSGFHSGDTLAFTNTSATLFGNISSAYNSSTGVLTLTSSGITATNAQWTNAFEAVTFASTSSSYGDRTISFVVSDGTQSSTAATKTLDVTNPDPVVTTDSGSAAFSAGDNTTSTPVTVDSGVTLTDGNDSTITQASVQITGNLHSSEDVLAFVNTSGTLFGNISESAYNSSNGTLTLLSSGNSATLAQWQHALEAITYTDTAVTPNTATRTVSFTVTDSDSNSSATATRTVTVADTDQTPIVTTTGGTDSYVGGTSATTVDSGVTVSDLDNTTQSSGTVSVGSGFHSGDILAFTNSSATLFGNIGASYNSGTGVLTLTSSGATATDAQWANAFDAVTFSSSSTTYGNRTISFVVNDGTENSTAATKTVDMTSPPTVTTDSGSAAFTAGDNTTSTPVVIDSGLTVTDPNSTTLASATVSITGNFHTGEDVLAFTNNNSTMGNIVGAYNATTGVMTLTGAGSTLAQWQAALESVTYTDSAVTPNSATRTISFVINDGTNSSATATRTVTVADTERDHGRQRRDGQRPRQYHPVVWHRVGRQWLPQRRYLGVHQLQCHALRQYRSLV